jgi:ribosomal protein S8
MSIINRLANRLFAIQRSDQILESRALECAFCSMAHSDLNKHLLEDVNKHGFQRSKDKIQRQVSQGKVKVKKNYRCSFSYTLPFTDGNFKKWISDHGFNNFPERLDMPTNRRISRETRDAIGRFKRSEGSLLGKRECSKIIESGLKAAEDLNISRVSNPRIGGRDGKRVRNIRTRTLFRTKEISEAIEQATKSTSAGWPTLKSKTSKEAQADVKIWTDRFLSNPTVYSIFKNPCIIFIRFQPVVKNLKDVEIKIRQVFGVPFRIVALENHFFGNVLSAYHDGNQRNPRPVSSSGLTNFEISQRIVSRLRNYIGSKGCLYSMDYSKFDSTIPPFAIDTFFLIMEESIQLDEKQKKALNFLRFYTKFTPLTWNSSLYILSRGIASGLLITNLFDSWWNLTLWYMAREIVSRNGIKSGNIEKYMNQEYVNGTVDSRNDIAVCGDDVLIFTTPREVTAHRILCERYNMKIGINVELNDSSGLTFFLGRYWDKLSRPVQSELYITTHLIVRTKWYKKESLDIDISKDLDIHRFLSIVCPLANGISYIRKYFSDWEPLKEFIRARKGFILLKDDYIGGNYNVKQFREVFDWRCY